MPGRGRRWGRVIGRGQPGSARPSGLIAAWIAGLVCASCGACVDEWVDEVDAVHAGEVEVVGVWGRRLNADIAYRVPLDSRRLVPIGQCTREALAVFNRSARQVVVERLIIDAEPGEWRLLEPTRVAEVPLAVAPRALRSGAKLDLDVAVCPRVSGLRPAWLGLAWHDGVRMNARWMRLEAEAPATPASPTGPDPPG
jgi:hypothetical protein